MKLFSLALSLFLLFSNIVHAQSNELESIDAQIFADYSYAYGMEITESLALIGLEPNETNVAAMMRGVQKAVEGPSEAAIKRAQADLKEYFGNKTMTVEIQEATSHRIGLIFTHLFFTDLKAAGKRFDNKELWAGCRTLLEGRTPRLTEEEANAALDAYLKVPREEEDTEEVD